jgi:hypothetical protein
MSGSHLARSAPRRKRFAPRNPKRPLIPRRRPVGRRGAKSLISDLFEGGIETEFLRRTHSLVASGVQFVALLALSDQGSPSYNAELAGQLANLGVPAFACTPDRFPDLMAAAIGRKPLTA